MKKRISSPGMRKRVLAGVAIAWVGMLSSCAGQVKTKAKAPSHHFATSWSEIDESVRTQAAPFLEANYSLEIAVVRDRQNHYYSFSKHSDEPLPDENTFFGVNSITKVFVGLVLAQMVTEKKLNLDDPVQRYFHKVKFPKYKGHPITFRALITQSSGLPFLPDNMGEVVPTDPYGKYTDRQLFRYLSHAQLDVEPGVRYRYSNLGFGVLGCILAKIDHHTFSDMIERRVSKPLGLKDTHAFVDRSMKDRLMLGHDSLNQALPPRTSSECMKGSWVIRSTASDLAKYVVAELHPGITPFPQAMRLSQMVSTVLEDEKTAVGFAWDVGTLSGTYSKAGAGGGLSSEVFFNPGRDTGLVILSSSWPKDEKFGIGELGRALMTDLR